MNDIENDVDYGSTIDRTIPDGTISVNEQGQQTVFKDGEFVIAETK
jgi:hypothetical protein